MMAGKKSDFMNLSGHLRDEKTEDRENKPPRR
jgi:hypothetical protein